MVIIFGCCRIYSVLLATNIYITQKLKGRYEERKANCCLFTFEQNKSLIFMAKYYCVRLHVAICAALVFGLLTGRSLPAPNFWWDISPALTLLSVFTIQQQSIYRIWVLSLLLSYSHNEHVKLLNCHYFQIPSILFSLASSLDQYKTNVISVFVCSSISGT